MKISELKEGHVLSNTEIAKIFLCSTQGGMRRSHRTNTLVLISDQTKVYHDYWHNGVLHYSGMGLVGNQDFDYMQNKTLKHSNENGVELHLFEVFRPKEYTYYGKVKLAAPPYTTHQPDQNNSIRIVCMFPLCRF